MVKNEKNIIAFRHANDGLNDETSRSTAFDNTDTNGDYDYGRTIQADKDDSDINVILSRFGVNASRNTNKQPLWGDFTAMPHDYQDSLNQVTDAQQKFNSMDARIRARFRNNPYEMLSWVQDPNNRKEAEDLGIVPLPKPAPAAEPAPKPTPEPSPKA